MSKKSLNQPSVQTVDLVKEAEAAKRASARKRTYRKAEPYIWIAPSLILMCIFILVPII